MIDLLELGDIDAVDIEIDAYAQIAARRRRLSDELYVHIYRAMRLLLAGEFEQAEAEGCAAVRVGDRVQDTNTGNATLLQSLHDCGASAAGSSGSRARCAPTPSGSRRSPAGAACSPTCSPRPAAPTRRARSSTTFAADDFRGLPLDGIWLGAVAYLAEAAAALGDPTHAAALHELLEPYADRNVAVGWASTCAGSASRHLGLLADLLGRRDEAVALLRDRAGDERADARAAVGGRARRSSSRACSSQEPADRERAAELLDGRASPRRSGSGCRGSSSWRARPGGRRGRAAA